MFLCRCGAVSIPRYVCRVKIKSNPLALAVAAVLALVLALVGVWSLCRLHKTSGNLLGFVANHLLFARSLPVLPSKLCRDGSSMLVVVQSQGYFFVGSRYLQINRFRDNAIAFGCLSQATSWCAVRLFFYRLPIEMLALTSVSRSAWCVMLPTFFAVACFAA